jgi:glycosyltransferase involved in cell wall biosynthesis
LKIAVNTRLLLPDKIDGIGMFTRETMKIIVQENPEHKFYFLFDRCYDSQYIFSDNVKPVVIPPPTRHPILTNTWFHCCLPLVFKRIKPDLFISTDGILSANTKVKQLSVIHDLNFEHNPDDLPKVYLKFYKKNIPASVKRAVRVATVSEFSKQDIAKIYNYDLDKIDVVGNGANEKFVPSVFSERQNIKEKYTDGDEYFVFVGSMHPRKNLSRLFVAYDEFCSESPRKAKLVVVGRKMWWTSEINNVYNNMKHKDNVVFTGRVPDDELVLLIGSALASVYVSLFEGFGIPIVESFACNVPVITSNITSMPEIAGDAAILCDPYSIDSIKNALITVANNDSLRLSLIEKGIKRLENYSWEKSAHKLWDCAMKALEE